MKNWLAHWLRKLATRLDGDLYFPVSPELKAAARGLIKPQFEQHVDEAMTLGNGGVQPQGVVPRQFPNTCVSRSMLSDTPELGVALKCTCDGNSPVDPDRLGHYGVTRRGNHHAPACPRYDRQHPSTAVQW